MGVWQAHLFTPIVKLNLGYLLADLCRIALALLSHSVYISVYRTIIYLPKCTQFLKFLNIKLWQVEIILEIRLSCVSFLYRYKMLSKQTWPNFKRGSEKDGTKVIINELNLGDDVQYGNTKVFIRSPRTVFALENKRTIALNNIAIFLQKVGFRYFAML